MGHLDANAIARLVDDQLVRVSSARVAKLIRELLVSPYRVAREWDYGDPGQTYPCWTVLEHPPSSTGIAYCEQGFGPSHPWGLVSLSDEHTSIGPDFCWYDALEVAFRESMAYEDDAVS
jgi:hypothetical protein